MSNHQIILFLFFLLFFTIDLTFTQKAHPKIKITKRQKTNLLLFVFNQVFMKLLFYFFPLYFYTNTNNPFDFTSLIKLIPFIFIFDLYIYATHRLFHKVPFLWKFHQIHHADTQLDTTTGIRFHIGELVISLLFKSIFFILCRFSLNEILIFEFILTVNSLFQHSKIPLTEKQNKILQKFIVTPKYHLYHHSAFVESLHSNFGLMLSYPDFLFKTRAKENKEYLLKIGLIDIKKKTAKDFAKMLLLPFSQTKN